MNQCECGCEKEVVKKHSWYTPRFIWGHNSKGKRYSHVAWNKGLTKEIDERVKKIADLKIGKSRSVEVAEKVRIALTGRKRPEISGDINSSKRPEVRKKISERTKEKWKDLDYRTKLSGENSNSWKGGLTFYYHDRAQELFATPMCQDCGISLEKYQSTHKQKRFHMHCISRDYTILTQRNWSCVCCKCHSHIHKEERSA